MMYRVQLCQDPTISQMPAVPEINRRSYYRDCVSLVLTSSLSYKNFEAEPTVVHEDGLYLRQAVLVHLREVTTPWFYTGSIRIYLPKRLMLLSRRIFSQYF